MRRPPRAFRSQSGEVGSVIVFLFILLAVIGGGWWFLKQNRDQREKEAWAFANEAADKIVLKRDTKFLDFNLTQKAQMTYPPSWRMRMMNYISEAGTPNPQFRMRGDMMFTNQFFEPSGKFIAEFDYPQGKGWLELHISHPGALWVIDDINWSWPPLPTPTPMPTAIPGASPSTPSPAPAKR